MSVDAATVKHIAHLARIRLEDAEVAYFETELNRILGWAEQLSEVDTSAVQPMTAVIANKLRLRADEVSDGDVREAVLANAPEAAHGFFTVPKVIE